MTEWFEEWKYKNEVPRLRIYRVKTEAGRLLLLEVQQGMADKEADQRKEAI